MSNAVAPPSLPLSIGAPLSGEPEPVLQWIEVASYLQIPSFHVIGLPSPEVAEARERVRAAIEAAGLEFPRRRVVINLSPASVRKRGTGVDLAMALGVLQDSYGLGPRASGRKAVAWGELGLDGAVKPSGQVTRAIYAAWRADVDLLILPASERADAEARLDWIRASGELPGEGPALATAETLIEAWKLLKAYGKRGSDAIVARAPDRAPGAEDAATARDGGSPGLMALPASMERVLGAAAAGAHHLLLLGSRGTGKSHALEWLMALQPPLPPALRVKHALLEELGAGGGRLPGSASVPVRRIGAQARPAALIGGAGAGNGVRPGELTLAHGGLLVADEFLEWPRDARETLREPLERGAVTLTRAHRSVELPARFALAANGNLCPCGGWPREIPLPEASSAGRAGRCRCTELAKRTYLARLSGPILDRMDLVVLVAGTSRERKGTGRAPAPSRAAERLEDLRERTRAARERSLTVWGCPAGQLDSAKLEAILASRPDWQDALDPASFASLRARHKTLRVALTLAAWDGMDAPSPAHFAEARLYRAERWGFGS